MRRRVVKTTGGGGCGATKDDVTTVECLFDQICSFGLYVIRYVMFLCFQVHFRTKQMKCFLAYVMLNIICFYVFMFWGMLQSFFTSYVLYYNNKLSLKDVVPLLYHSNITTVSRSITFFGSDSY